MNIQDLLHDYQQYTNPTTYSNINQIVKSIDTTSDIEKILQLCLLSSHGKYFWESCGWDIIDKIYLLSFDENLTEDEEIVLLKGVKCISEVTSSRELYLMAMEKMLDCNEINSFVLLLYCVQLAFNEAKVFDFQIVQKVLLKVLDKSISFGDRLRASDETKKIENNFMKLFNFVVYFTRGLTFRSKEWLNDKKLQNLNETVTSNESMTDLLAKFISMFTSDSVARCTFPNVRKAIVRKNCHLLSTLLGGAWDRLLTLPIKLRFEVFKRAKTSYDPIKKQEKSPENTDKRGIEVGLEVELIRWAVRLSPGVYLRAYHNKVNSGKHCGGGAVEECIAWVDLVKSLSQVELEVEDPGLNLEWSNEGVALLLLVLLESIVFGSQGGGMGEEKVNGQGIPLFPLVYKSSFLVEMLQRCGLFWVLVIFDRKPLAAFEGLQMANLFLNFGVGTSPSFGSTPRVCFTRNDPAPLSRVASLHLHFFLNPTLEKELCGVDFRDLRAGFYWVLNSVAAGFDSRAFCTSMVNSMASCPDADIRSAGMSVLRKFLKSHEERSLFLLFTGLVHESNFAGAFVDIIQEICQFSCKNQIWSFRQFNPIIPQENPKNPNLQNNWILLLKQNLVKHSLNNLIDQFKSLKSDNFDFENELEKLSTQKNMREIINNRFELLGFGKNSEDYNAVKDNLPFEFWEMKVLVYDIINEENLGFEGKRLIWSPFWNSVVLEVFAVGFFKRNVKFHS